MWPRCLASASWLCLGQILRHAGISGGFRKDTAHVTAIGGTPGAFAGQRVLRHKTQKQPFGTYLLLIAIAQAIGILALIVLSGGSAAALLLI